MHALKAIISNQGNLEMNRKFKSIMSTALKYITKAHHSKQHLIGTKTTRFSGDLRKKPTHSVK